MSRAYEVRLRGPASVHVLEALCEDVAMKADTVVHGLIEDQAALQGLLDRIRDIGLEIIDIRQVSHWRGRPPGNPPEITRPGRAPSKWEILG